MASSATSSENLLAWTSQCNTTANHLAGLVHIANAYLVSQSSCQTSGRDTRWYMCTFENVASIGSLLSQDKIFPLHTIDNMDRTPYFLHRMESLRWNGRYSGALSLWRLLWSHNSHWSPKIHQKCFFRVADCIFPKCCLLLYVPPALVTLILTLRSHLHGNVFVCNFLRSHFPFTLKWQKDLENGFFGRRLPKWIVSKRSRVNGQKRNWFISRQEDGGPW